MLELFLGGRTKNVTTVTGEIIFANGINGTATTRSWIVPKGVYSVSAVVVGQGGGGYDRPGAGGDLRWISELEVTPGETITVTVGPGGSSVASALLRGSSILITAKAGSAVAPSSEIDGVLIGGGNGGLRGYGTSGAGDSIAGGGGAGGYLGNGGDGANTSSNAGTAGQGGGGGGGGRFYANYSSRFGAAAGGGVGLYGIKNGVILNGAGGTYEIVPSGSNISSSLGRGGSGGGDAIGGSGGTYGGGSSYQGGGGGAVRIIWGPGRSFPNNAA